MRSSGVAFRRTRSRRSGSQRRGAARAVRPVPPATVEEIRRKLIGGNRVRTPTLVSMLAYAGLRPGEALALRWGDVGERTILVERAAALGDVKETKQDRRVRFDCWRRWPGDLREWRIKLGRPDDDALVFPTSDGRVWPEEHWRNWRQRVFAPAAKCRWARPVSPVRPSAFVRIAPLRRRTNGDRGRAAGRTLRDDGACHLWPRNRGAGGYGAGAGGGRDPQGPRPACSLRVPSSAFGDCRDDRRAPESCCKSWEAL